MIFLSGWLLGGAYLDAWAHQHLRLETFFTPWHAILYSGLLATVGFLGFHTIRNVIRGAPWRTALPAGYELSGFGCVLFIIAGVSDLGWHTLFGIDVSVAGLVSPTHLLLMLSAGLVVTGPLRAAWRSRKAVAPYSAVISAAGLLSLMSLFEQIDHPFVELWSAGDPSDILLPFYAMELGVIGIVLQSGVIMAVVLLMLRRFVLPAGSVTLIFGINAALVSIVREQFLMIGVALLAGAAADTFLSFAGRPLQGRALRLFSFLTPAFLTLTYFAVLMTTQGVWWSVHVWAGSIVVAGLVGWLLSYLVEPPGQAPPPDPTGSLGRRTHA